MAYSKNIHTGRFISVPAPTDLLVEDHAATFCPDPLELEIMADLLVESFEAYNIKISVAGIIPGPTIIRFEATLGRGVRISEVKAIQDNIMAALDLPSMDIEAPILGTNLIGIDIPNTHKNVIRLRSILDSERFVRASRTSVALGMNINCDPILFDIATGRHLLITGSDPIEIEALCNSIVASSLCKAYPYDIRMVMVDPVYNSSRHFNGIPHLLMPVVTNPIKATNAIRRVKDELTRRMELLSKYSIRSIDSLRLTRNALPHIVLFLNSIDSLSPYLIDNWMDDLSEILSKGPGFGIHLIASSRVNTDNRLFLELNDRITHKVIFRVNDEDESRAVIHSGGAEQLAGFGDMFFYDSSTNISIRSNCPTITPIEIQDLVSYFRKKTNLYTIGDQPIEANTLFEHAVEIVLRSGRATIPLVQRSLNLDYSDAVVLIYQMEQEHITEPLGSDDPGKVLVTREQWNTIKQG